MSLCSAGAASDFLFLAAAEAVADSEDSEVLAVAEAEAFPAEAVPSAAEEPDAVFKIQIYGVVRCLKILTVRITVNISKY